MVVPMYGFDAISSLSFIEIPFFNTGAISSSADTNCEDILPDVKKEWGTHKITIKRPIV